MEKLQSMSLSGGSRGREGSDGNRPDSAELSPGYVERTKHLPDGLDPRKNSVVDIKAGLLPIDEKSDFVGLKSDINANNLCPGFIDMCDMKIKSKYVRTYAFAVDSMTKTVFR